MASFRKCNDTCERRFIMLTIGFGCVFVATVFIIVALTTNNWYEIWDGYSVRDKIETHYGLHRICFTDTNRCTFPESSYDKKNYLSTIQGMIITGGFVAVVANAFALVHMLTDRLGWTHLVIMIPATFTPLVAGLFEMVGCILYAEKVELDMQYFTYVKDQRLGYSFGLDVTASALLLIGGILNGLCSLSKPSPKFVM